nr:hypothetical protein [Tanacetum cinerariifolium]
EGVAAVFEGRQHVEYFVRPARDEGHAVLGAHVERGGAVAGEVEEVQAGLRGHVGAVGGPFLSQGAVVAGAVPELAVGENHDFIDYLAALAQVLNDEVAVGRIAYFAL